MHAIDQKRKKQTAWNTKQICGDARVEEQYSHHKLSNVH